LNSLKKILIKPEDSLQHAIKVLNDGGTRITLVVDKSNKLLGTVTDGDIRRALINKFTMTSPIKLIMNKQPIFASKASSKKDILQLMTSQGIIHMPVLDNNGVIYDLETIEHLIKSQTFDNTVFLMAGGFGKRLHPLTEDTPKPLLKVGDRPIIETIIQQFIDHGFKNFFISTHYKSEQIKEFFKDGSQYGVNINYINEVEPLGTAGSLGLLPEDIPDLPIIVMNGDLLTKVNFQNLLDFHNNGKSDATMCIREYDVQVPFGVVEINKGEIKQIREKPVHKFFVNAGIYVVNKHLINKIHGNTYLDMPDFLETELREKGKGINAFPIHEYWIDIGRIDEYTKAKKDASLFK
jgi:dTDP-glucose pyrophosphorylase